VEAYSQVAEWQRLGLADRLWHSELGRERGLVEDDLPTVRPLDHGNQALERNLLGRCCRSARSGRVIATCVEALELRGRTQPVRAPSPDRLAR